MHKPVQALQARGGTDPQEGRGSMIPQPLSGHVATGPNLPARWEPLCVCLACRAVALGRACASARAGDARRSSGSAVSPL